VPTSAGKKKIKNQEDQAGEVPAAPSLGSGEKKKKPAAAADKGTHPDVSIFVILTDSITD